MGRELRLPLAPLVRCGTDSAARFRISVGMAELPNEDVAMRGNEPWGALRAVSFHLGPHCRGVGDVAAYRHLGHGQAGTVVTRND